MPAYSYTAVSAEGQEFKANENAKDERELAQILKQKGSVLLSAKVSKKTNIWSFEFNIPAADKLFFFRNLKVMISAGVALPKSLDILIKQVKSKKFKSALEEIKEQITKGQAFSEAIGRQPAAFSELAANMIKVGEESGTLEQVLGQLSSQMEREMELKSKIMGALMYPAVIVCTMLGIGVLMLIMVVPQLAKTFKEFGIDLPPTTKFVIGLAQVMRYQWYYLIAGILAFFAVLWRMGKLKKGKRILDLIYLKIPILALLSKKTNTASCARTLSSLISSGVPIVASLEITSRVLKNSFFQESLLRAADEVRKGAKISDALKDFEHLYSPLFIQMLEVGEETGKTAEILEKLAGFFEEEVSNAAKNFASLIEPMLMLLIGAAVGFFAVSMLQPMYSMLNSMR